MAAAGTLSRPVTAEPPAAPAPVVSPLQPRVGLQGRPVVRRILYERSPIFTEEDRIRLHWLPLGLVNALHVDTRTRVIRRELVFERGERVDEELLEQSERRLRSSGFFGEASLEVVPVAADSVDVVVRTREIWTTAVNIQYERFESETLWGAQLRERNFLGLAKAFSVSRNEDEDRTTWAFSAGDRQLFDGRWRGRISFADSDDGTSTYYQLRRPFFRLDSMWGGNGEYFNRGARVRYYLNESQYIRPQAKFSGFETSVGHRLAWTPTGVWRWGLGISVSNQTFASEDGLTVYDADGELDTTASLPDDIRENRRLRVLYVSVNRATREYGRHRFLHAMGRIEDVALGFEHYLDVGWAAHVADATDGGIQVRSSHEWTGESGSSVYTADADFRSLFTAEGAKDLRLTGSLASYLSLRPSLRLALDAVGATGSDLDRDTPYFLGLATGLRAASFHEFAGDRLLRANAELRWVYMDGLLDLVTPGLVCFLDVGTAWFEAQRDLTFEQFRGAVGVGLRFGFNRGSEEAPIRLDLGWPLLYDNGRGGAVLSIGTGQVF